LAKRLSELRQDSPSMLNAEPVDRGKVIALPKSSRTAIRQLKRSPSQWRKARSNAVSCSLRRASNHCSNWSMMITSFELVDVTRRLRNAARDSIKLCRSLSRGNWRRSAANNRASVSVDEASI
jgi:hypothetical protein